MSESQRPQEQTEASAVEESPALTPVEAAPASHSRLPIHVGAAQMAEWTIDGQYKLTPRQVKALQVLSNSFGAEDAASAAGVSRATVYRWLKSE